ncbi:MAG: DNA cytosine methyltransferase [Comamonadaceae bacterium]|nr:MAG: DNA cytosine methyltransferase [Comamonadaceae bacterium]
MSDNRILELFAGAGGWSEGLRRAGIITEIDGIEWNKDACATARAAGHPRFQADVSQVDPHDYQSIDGIIASPPCTGFSPAGKGRGREDARLLLDALADINTEADVVAAISRLHRDMVDDRSLFVLEPLRYMLALKPTWTAWEQVPVVLPIWEACADVLRRNGYTVDTGVLHTEQYGVPQTRRRAILVAHAPWVETPAQLPAPTHSLYHLRRPGKLDPGLQKWVSIQDVLGPRPGWEFAGAGATARTTAGQIPRSLDEPAHTIAGKGSAAWTPIDPGEGKPSTVRVSVEEAAALQTFPRGYPWRGSLTAQYRQVGDCVPPMLARAVLKPILEAVSRDSPRAVAA